MGLFFYTKKGSIISTVDLPTTEIIEPFYVILWQYSQAESFFYTYNFDIMCTVKELVLCIK